MMGWGSSVIVDDKGTMITNNHVVADGERVNSAFLVCVTKEISKRPSCDYTASLIDRDEKMDIAILRIDPIDIYGKKVDYTKFQYAPLDYEYVPKVQDTVVVVWYPWIGADTITETKGIISGVSEKNGYEYLKTDAKIGMGVSWWPIFKGWKVIGLMTFWMGGFWWDMLGYGLLITNAKDFIESNKEKEGKENSIGKVLDFVSYRKSIEEMNKKWNIRDDVFEVTIPQSYELWNYRKNTFIEIRLKENKDQGISQFSIKVEKTPILHTEKQKVEFLEHINFFGYNWNDFYVLKKREISGIPFYYFAEKRNVFELDEVSMWGSHTYIGFLTGYMIVIDFYIESYLDSKTTKQELRDDLSLLLHQIKIFPDRIHKADVAFSPMIPRISVRSFKNSTSYFFDTRGIYRFYFSGTLNDYIDVWVGYLEDEYYGKWKTWKEIYDAFFKNRKDGIHAFVSFRWLEWFIACEYREKTKPIRTEGEQFLGILYNEWLESYRQGDVCSLVVFFPENKELDRHPYMVASIVTREWDVKEMFPVFVSFVSRYVNTFSSGNTNIPSPFEKKGLQFMDIEDQSLAYKNFLSLLVDSGLLQNEKLFSWDKPLMWWEFLYMYVKWVYNFPIDTHTCVAKDYDCIFRSYKRTINGKEVSLDTIFKELGIDGYYSYVPAEKLEEYRFHNVLKYKLAGVNINYTTLDVELFEKNSFVSHFSREMKKVIDFEKSIYGGGGKLFYRNALNNVDAKYISRVRLYYIPEKQEIVRVPITENKKISFSSKEDIQEKHIRETEKLKESCFEKKTYDQFIACYKQYKNRINSEISFYPSHYGFRVLTKGEAIEYMVQEVDFGLFVPSLKSFKEKVKE